MRNKYKVTYDNHSIRCSLNTEICTVIFADSELEAKEICSDCYDDMNGHFRILNVFKI